MTKKEFTQYIRALGFTNRIFFETVGLKSNAFSAIREDEQISEKHMKMLELFKYKIKYEKLLADFETFKKTVENPL